MKLRITIELIPILLITNYLSINQPILHNYINYNFIIDHISILHYQVIYL